jgi:23S rRNA pseudouridine2605 synthase
VTVDGRIAADPRTRVVPERVRLAIDGHAVAASDWRAILFHKPRGVVTTTHDPEGRPTVFDVLGAAGRRLRAVGRLDLATTGLLILTTDTRLAAWLTDPANAIERTYVVTVRGAVGEPTVTQIETGVEANGERLQAAHVEVRKRSRRETHLIVTLTEGKNREIRRLFASRGHEVTRLTRIRFGGFALGSLPPGAWREISREELVAAFPDAPLTSSARRQSPRSARARR